MYAVARLTPSCSATCAAGQLAPSGVHKERVRTDEFFTVDPEDGRILRSPGRSDLRPSEWTSAATLTVDALDRPKTRTVGSSVDTYGYLGASPTAYEVGSASTDSLLDLDGSRLAVKTGSTVSWLVFDLHGSVAALCPAGSSTLSDADRYDPWGQPITAGTTANPWRYRGLLDISPNMAPLLELGARVYSPELGTFTAEDTVAGHAADPASMNRYLYAEADPTTLIDPDGHGILTLNCGDQDYCAVTGTVSRQTVNVVSDSDRREQVKQWKRHEYIRNQRQPYEPEDKSPSRTLNDARLASFESDIGTCGFDIACLFRAGLRAAEVDYISLSGTGVVPTYGLFGPAGTVGLTFTRTGHTYFSLGLGLGFGKGGRAAELRAGNIIGCDRSCDVDSFVNGASVTASGLAPVVGFVGPSFGATWGNVGTFDSRALSYEYGIGIGTPGASLVSTGSGRLPIDFSGW